MKPCGVTLYPESWEWITTINSLPCRAGACGRVCGARAPQKVKSVGTERAGCYELFFAKRGREGNRGNRGLMRAVRLYGIDTVAARP